jgi:nucleoid-associated protein YgaU
MSYSFYIGDTLLPVAPSRLEIVYGNKLKRIDLASGGEIVFPDKKSLDEIRFSALLPQAVYPFAVYKSGFIPGGNILRDLLSLKESCKPFRFIVFRKTVGGKTLASTNIKAVFSEIRSREEAGEGSDIYIDVKLVEYRDFSVKNVSMNSSGGMRGAGSGGGGGGNLPPAVLPVIRPPALRPVDTMPVTRDYRVVSGDSLWMLAHRFLGNGSRYKEIYNMNKADIDFRNLGKGTSVYTIFAEQMLMIPKR